MYDTFGPPVSKSSAWIVPGIGAGDPWNGNGFGPGGGGGAGALGATSVIDRMLKPPASNPSVMTCWPAPSVTGTLIVVHVCQPPVFGMPIGVHTFAGPLNPRCSAPPPFSDATRSCAV